jgi:hypothetical protein
MSLVYLCYRARARVLPLLSCTLKHGCSVSPLLSWHGAGVSRAGLVDWLAMRDFRFCMEVNFFAVVSVTKTFLPLIKRGKGRIINMSSAAGVACGYPITCAYSASKHAVELFTSSLRQEMKPWGIKVRGRGHSTTHTGRNFRSHHPRQCENGVMVCFPPFCDNA